MEIPSLALNDGNKIPLLSFGTGTAWYKDGGKGPLDKDLIQRLKSAIGLGFRHIDGADAYGTEEEVGIAVKESNLSREELFVTTKVQDNVLDIPNAIDVSLEKLQLDYVDLYMIHNPFFAKDDADLQKTWKDMEDVKKSGKAKSIGVSNYLQPHLEAVMKTAIVTPAINQIEYQPYLQRANNFVPWMKEHRIEIEAFKPLAPILSGKGGPLDGPLVKMAEAHGVTTNAILLRWQIQQNVVAITTTKSDERMHEYLKVLTFQLSAEEMEEITQVGASHHWRAGYRKRFDPDDRT